MPIKYITDGDSDGSVMGRTSTEKIGFFGATPIVKTSVTDYTTTTASTSTSPWGYGSSTQATALNAAVVAIMARGKALGLW